MKQYLDAIFSYQMLLRHYININPMIYHKLFEYICNLLKSIYQLSWVIKTSIICRPMCLCVFRILLFLTPMFYAVAKQIWHMIDGQNLNYVHGQTIQRFRQWYDWTVSGIFTFNLRMPWDSSNKNVKKSFVWNKIEIILPRDMLFLIIQSALCYGFISYCIIKSKWHF